MQTFAWARLPGLLYRQLHLSYMCVMNITAILVTGIVLLVYHAESRQLLVVVVVL